MSTPTSWESVLRGLPIRAASYQVPIPLAGEDYAQPQDPGIARALAPTIALLGRNRYGIPIPPAWDVTTTLNAIQEIAEDRTTTANDRYAILLEIERVRMANEELVARNEASLRIAEQESEVRRHERRLRIAERELRREAKIREESLETLRQLEVVLSSGEERLAEIAAEEVKRWQRQYRRAISSVVPVVAPTELAATAAAVEEIASEQRAVASQRRRIVEQIVSERGYLQGVTDNYTNVVTELREASEIRRRLAEVGEQLDVSRQRPIVYTSAAELERNLERARVRNTIRADVAAWVSDRYRLEHDRNYRLAIPQPIYNAPQDTDGWRAITFGEVAGFTHILLPTNRAIEFTLANYESDMGDMSYNIAIRKLTQFVATVVLAGGRLIWDSGVYQLHPDGRMAAQISLRAVSPDVPECDSRTIRTLTFTYDTTEERLATRFSAILLGLPDPELKYIPTAPIEYFPYIGEIVHFRIPPPPIVGAGGDHRTRAKPVEYCKLGVGVTHGGDHGYCLLTAAAHLVKGSCGLTPRGSRSAKHICKDLGIAVTDAGIAIEEFRKMEAVLGVTTVILNNEDGVVLREANPDLPRSTTCVAIVYDKTHNHFFNMIQAAPEVESPITKSPYPALKRTQLQGKQLRPTRYCVYDFETITCTSVEPLSGPANTIIHTTKHRSLPYSIAALVYEVDKEGTIPTTSTEFRSRGRLAFFAAGSPVGNKSPLMKFVSWLIGEVGRNYNLVLEAFNGAKFDHLILIQALQELDHMDSDSITIHGTRVDSARTKQGHSFHDLARFLTGSLDTLCTSFKTSRRKVEGFDHYLPQYEWDVGGSAALDKWITTNYESILHYNVMDILSLAELTFLIQKTFGTIFDDFELDLLEQAPGRIAELQLECLEKGKKFRLFDQRLHSYPTASTLSYTILKKLQSLVPRDLTTYPDAVWAERLIYYMRLLETTKRERRKKQNKGAAERTMVKVQRRIDELETIIRVIEDETDASTQLERCERPTTARDHAMNRIYADQKAGKIPTPTISMVQPPPTLKDNEECRRAAYAGRVQVMSDGGKATSVTTNIQMLDITSSYPTSMQNCRFPYGVGKQVDHYVPGKLGYYWCTVVRQPDLTIVPKRGGATLDWRHTGKMEDWINSVDIENIRKHGGEVIVHHGTFYRWDSTDQFAPYISRLYAEKKRLDQLSGTAMANPAKRELVKLLLNSISGKVGERPHFEVCKLSTTATTTRGVLELVEWDTVNMDEQWRDAILITGEMKRSVKESRYLAMVRAGRASPTIHSGLIYSYSRDRLYEGLQYAGAVGYCDTDSVTMLHSDYLRFRDAKPELFVTPGKPKELGQWECELKQDGATNYELIRLAPKEYAVFDPAGVMKPKVRTKGVSKRDYRLMDEEEVRMVKQMTTAERSKWAYEHPERRFANADVAYNSFHERVAGKATYWLCVHSERYVGSARCPVGSSGGFGVIFSYRVKKYGGPTMETC